MRSTDNKIALRSQICVENDVYLNNLMYQNRYSRTQDSNAVKVAVYEAQKAVPTQQYVGAVAFAIAVLSAWAAFGGF